MKIIVKIFRKLIVFCGALAPFLCLFLVIGGAVSITKVVCSGDTVNLLPDCALFALGCFGLGCRLDNWSTSAAADYL